MKYEKDFKNLQLAEDTVLSLGKFDGLHRGHELLLDCVFEKAKTGLKTAVFTFDRPPKQGTQTPFRKTADSGNLQQVITTNEEKQRLFEKRGVDYLIECPFTDELMHMSAEQFIAEIVQKLRVRWVIAGTDFRFGHNRRGDYRMLQNYAAKFSYQVQVVPKMQHEGRDISSTYIREELAKGNMRLVNQLLGYPYFLQGTVIHGNQLGRTIGFPTINIKPPVQKLLPPFGVYVSRIHLDGQEYRGITNIGIKPTVHGNSPAGAETYIYNFNGNAYDKKVRIDLWHFLRPEKKFASMEQLRTQLVRDIACGEKFA